jgi:hypothetical protein
MSTLFQILVTAILATFSPQKDSAEEVVVKPERTEQLKSASADDCPAV